MLQNMVASDANKEPLTKGLEPFNPFVPAFSHNPYPFYKTYRDLDPVNWGKPDLPGLPGCWYVFRYEDVITAFKSNRIGKEIQRVMPAEKLPPTPDSIKPFMTTINHWMLRKDPPDHTRLRSLVSKAFTPKMVENLRPRIETIADTLLDQLAETSQTDLMANYAALLPVTVIAEMLGVSPQDHVRFRGWSNTLATGFAARTSDEVAIRANQATLELSEYLSYIVAARRENPQEDLISSLIAAEEQGGKLTEAELIANCILLLFAGHETTVNLIGNGMLALLENRDQLELLEQNPGLAENAVEELLRYNSPTQLVPRWVFEDIELGGKLLHKGEHLMTVPGAGNHDPQVFADPERLDIRRNISNRHSAFGMGIHFCLGAPLARLEGEVAINKLLHHFPNIELATPSVNLEWHKTVVFRGLQALPVTLY